MKHLILGCWCLMIFTNNYAQEKNILDSAELARMPAFTDIDSALKNPDKVYKLILRRKKLKSFPKEIFQFKNLQYLDLSKNDIKELPENLGELKYLQYFACSKCNLQKIPSGIGQLEYLYYLNLNQNNIDSLPNEIGQLKRLQILDLWDNNLSYFPDSMRELESLKKMDIRSILLNQEQQNYIQSLLPDTKIYFSPPCKCSW